MEKPSALERLNNWVRQSIMLKLVTIVILILLLLIPTAMLTSLIRERQHLRDDATEEVSGKWGGEQTIGGPVISVPYTVTVRTNNGETVKEIRYAHFLPDELNITGDLKPEKRYRGIYVVMLYNAKLHVSGKFQPLDARSLNIDESQLMFDQAYFSIGIEDMKGINDNIDVKLNDSVITINPGLPTHDIFSSGGGFEIALNKKSGYTFSFDVNINGSSAAKFLPFGRQTTVALHSPWNSPSFEGSFLPDKRDINKDGFTASWKVLQLNRNYPQQGLGSYIDNRSKDDYVYNRDEALAAFGVRLMLPVDEYLKTTRSVKYALMFIILTFISFFFIEVLNQKRIHPIQYLLVGFAVCLFYLLLLALSEHVSFNVAYATGSLVILSLITFYARHVLANSRLTLIFSALLALLYGFFYSLLQLEDYSLLMGSLGLLLILATIMYLTRKVNWYNINRDKE